MNAQTITEMQLINLCTRIAEDAKGKPGEYSLSYLECFLDDCEFTESQVDWIKLEVKKRLLDLNDADRPVVKPTPQHKATKTPPDYYGLLIAIDKETMALSELRELAEVFAFQPGVGGKYLTDREREAYVAAIRRGGDMSTLLDYVLCSLGLTEQQRQIVVDMVAEF